MRGYSLMSAVFLTACLFNTGVSALKCKVGVGILSKELDCSGDFTAMKTKLASFGGNITDPGSLFTKAISSATGRKRRQTETTTAAPATTSQDPSTKYYCLTHEVGPITIKSCAPESVLGIAKALCEKKDGVENCACSTELCNKSGALNLASGKFLVMITTCLALIFSTFKQ